MKLDCQNILTQFASLSVEELTDSEAASLLHHIEECEPCKGQWLLFEKTLTIVTQSGPREQDVEQTRSQQMWLVCMEHARQNAETHDEAHARPASPAHSAPSDSAPAVKHHKSQSEASVLVAPRAGLMLVGGALLLLASAHWMAPRPAPTDHALPPMPAQMQTVGFESLPQRSATLVDYGATLGFNAFSDHIEPTLISVPTKKAASTAKVQPAPNVR